MSESSCSTGAGYSSLESGRKSPSTSNHMISHDQLQPYQHGDENRSSFMHNDKEIMLFKGGLQERQLSWHVTKYHLSASSPLKYFVYNLHCSRTIQFWLQTVQFDWHCRIYLELFSVRITTVNISAVKQHLNLSGQYRPLNCPVSLDVSYNDFVW